MRKQRSMPPMKQQEKTSENKLNKMEASKLLEAEFKILVIRMLNELRGRMDGHNENLNREIVSIKKDRETIKNQTEMKNIITNKEYTRRIQ